MSISKDILLAILSLDAYNRGYGAGIEGLKQKAGTKIGPATIKKNAEDDLDDGAAQSVGFYAIAYDTSYGTVISYRGTDEEMIGPAGSGSPAGAFRKECIFLATKTREPHGAGPAGSLFPPCVRSAPEHRAPVRHQ